MSARSESSWSLSSCEEGRAVGQLSNQLGRYLEGEYHDALFSDLNYLPLPLQQQKTELQHTLNQEILKQTELNEQINDAQFEIQRLDAEIQALKEAHTALELVRETEEAKAKQQAEAEKKLREDALLRVSVETEQLRAKVEAKSRSDADMLRFLRRATEKQEAAVAEWRAKVGALQERIDLEGGLEVRVEGSGAGREAAAKLEADRRAGLKASIQKLREYIARNQHFLSA